MRRTLFGFSVKPPKETREPEVDPGLSKMFDLNLMNKIGARPPPLAELVQAWEHFFAYKLSKNEGLNELQAQHVLRTFEHLQKYSEEGIGLSLGVLRSALGITRILPEGGGELHAELARKLYQELSRRNEAGLVVLKNFSAVLANTGHANEARDLAMQYSAGNLGAGQSNTSSKDNIKKTGQRLWIQAMEGYAKENNETELLNTADLIEAAGFQRARAFHEVMTTFYASKNDVTNTKKWYSKTPHDQSHKSTPEMVSTVLQFCLRNNESEWCKTVFRNIVDENPPKPVWDILFQEAAGALGKGVEDVERMMEVMIRHNTSDETMRPDVDTINGLVKFAMSLNDPYLAERYIALGQKYGIRPNAQTYVLQLDYRVAAGDLTGAQAAYEALQSEEISNDSDLPAINKYIRGLCSSKANNYNRVVSICADLDERNARLEPSTVSALCLLYLSRGEMNDVFDTLQVNVFHYTLAERASILNTLVAYCLDRNNSTTDAWEAYNITRHVFQEASIEIRTKLMNEFFARQRSDMACHVFGHMRQHIRQEFRPVLETYIDCFRGIARCNDNESLDMVHNMLKMDSSIEPNTKLYNSLMMAYTECDEGDRALDFWDDITNSREGPSYESLELVFKACEKHAFGDRTAREVWSKMRRMEIEVTRDVFVAYVGALAGQGMMEEAQGVVEGAEKDLGLKPDVLT